jgi:hypothetical protein
MGGTDVSRNAEKNPVPYEDMERFVLTYFDSGLSKVRTAVHLKFAFSLKTKREALDVVDEVLYKRCMERQGRR